MAEKRSSKKRRKGNSEDLGTPTKDEKKVAQYLRFNLETKKASLYGNEAFYFYGSKAVDFLLESKWATSNKYSVAFTHRESVVVFINRLIGYGMLSHVDVIKIEKKVKDKKKDDKTKSETTSKEKVSDEKEAKEEKKAPSSPRPKKDGKELKKVKKKVKTTLEYHDMQVFVDDENEAYVWTYDPLSWTTLLLGILLVLAAILICLFPLWPENIREYSWYLSVAGAIFVGAILVLAILRYVIFGLMWLMTMGKLHFWLLPNLTAECGFFESFVPAYEYEMKSKSSDKGGKKSKRKLSQQGSDDKHKNDEKTETQCNRDLLDDITNVKKDQVCTGETPEKQAAPNIDNVDQADFKVESEESSGSKDEEWVKVKKDDATAAEC